MKILFIEDDAMNRRVVKDMLDVAGVKMAEADDGPTGLTMIDAADYDVILLDLRMPGMDGLEVISHIRSRTDDKADLPIIVVTADTAPNLKEDCIGAGADDVLFKPIAMQGLFDSIALRVMERQERRSQ